jgi:ankyrin repeat protein
MYKNFIHLDDEISSLNNNRLFTAINFGYHQEVEELLKNKKLGINARMIGGQTALISSIVNEYPNITEMLLQVPDINVNLPDHYGLTPLMHAVIKGNQKVVELLLAKEVDIFQQDCEHRTAFSLAIEYRRNNIYHLIESRVNEINLLNSVNHTSSSSERKRNYQEINENTIGKYTQEENKRRKTDNPSNKIIYK